MKYRKLMQRDGQVRVKFVTTDSKVPEVVKFIEDHNPNEKDSDVAADITAT